MLLALMRGGEEPDELDFVRTGGGGEVVPPIGGDGLPLFAFGIGLVPPWDGRALRIAWAPKLMRRAKGVVGAVRAFAVEDGSSSSIALSSIESELLVDILVRRMPKGVAPANGADPDRPTVEIESRRR
jgi:hypothetical protein